MSVRRKRYVKMLRHGNCLHKASSTLVQDVCILPWSLDISNGFLAGRMRRGASPNQDTPEPLLLLRIE
ncbi:MAG: hypothetical protein O2960_28085, partial [Verrucomicrobia bacterium]|nr:hypothetical protein [Verrucomicrobiota bacterium]